MALSRSLVWSLAIALLAALLSLAAAPVDGEGERVAAEDRDAARALLDRGRTAEALAAYEALAAAHPEDPVAWFDLAQAHHLSGDYAKAHEVGARGAGFAEIRSVALYNMACASALLGESDRAARELEQAIAAGFADFDLMETDGDLASLRSAARLPLPVAHRYETLRHGGVSIPYKLLLPADHDPERSYPAAVVFAPGGMGKRSTDHTLDTFWADTEARGDWIVVCAAQPSNGWINHPSHHALNALMKHVRQEHAVEQNRFHLIGLGAGARAAGTYGGMSRSYVRSVVLVDDVPYRNWDDEVVELAEDSLPVAMIVTEAWDEAAGRVHALLEGAGGAVHLDRAGSGGSRLAAGLTAAQVLGAAESVSRRVPSRR